jgi:hypothetical protein
VYSCIDPRRLVTARRVSRTRDGELAAGVEPHERSSHTMVDATLMYDRATCGRAMYGRAFAATQDVTAIIEAQ